MLDDINSFKKDPKRPKIKELSEASTEQLLEVLLTPDGKGIDEKKKALIQVIARALGVRFSQ